MERPPKEGKEHHMKKGFIGSARIAGMGVLLFMVSGCGKTHVKVVNSSSAAFESVTISIRGTGGGTTVKFNSLAVGATSGEEKWDDDDHLDVKLSTSGPSKESETDGVSLDSGKTNTITIWDGGSAGKIKYSRAAD